MSLFHYAAAASSALILTACAYGQPHSYAQNETDNTQAIEMSSSPDPMRTAQYPQYLSQEQSTYASTPSRYVAARFAYRPQPQLIRASAQMPVDSRQLQWNTHIVKEGDTAYSLGRKYCSEITDIRRYNGLNSEYSLQVGQAIILPRTNC